MDVYRFGRMMTAIVTPFEPSGSVDFPALERVARYLEAAGNDALVVTGSTGESATLTDGERYEVWRAVVEATTIPVIAGATTNDTAHSLRLVAEAERAGAQGILAVTPYYNRPPQAGLVRHFGAICDATELPVILYDIPVRTGRKIAINTTLELIGRHSNLVGVKDASGDVVGAGQLLAAASREIVLYSGDDALLLPFLSVGGYGLISVAGHWATPVFAALIDAFAKGDVARAVRLGAVLDESCRFETGDLYPNPIPSKAMLTELGLLSPVLRSPMIDVPAELFPMARRVFDGLVAAARSEGIELGE